MTVSKFTEQIETAISHALNHFSKPGMCPLTFDDMSVNVWPQARSDTSLGRGGLGGQMMTAAYTIVVGCDLTGQYAVYVDGRFYYDVLRPSGVFLDAVRKQCVWGIKLPDYEKPMRTESLGHD